MTEKTPSLWLPWPTVVALIVAGAVTIYGIVIRSEPIQNAGVWTACLVTMATLFLFSRLAREQAARLQVATEYNHTLARLHTIALAERDRALEQLRVIGETDLADLDDAALAERGDIVRFLRRQAELVGAYAPQLIEGLITRIEAGHHTTQEPEA